MTTMTMRKLVVKVCEICNLLPKYSHNTSSPYAILDFNGQHHLTCIVPSNLNPISNEPLKFLLDNEAVVAPLPILDAGILKVEVVHDRHAIATCRNNFLGRVCIGSSQFMCQGKEALVYFPLECHNFFSWVRGEIGLQIYYVDEVAGAINLALPTDAPDLTPAPPKLAEQQPDAAENRDPPKDPPLPWAAEESPPTPT